VADKSPIEWTDATWNPVRGCSRVSPGCGGPGHAGGCYAEGVAARFSDPGQAHHGFAERGRAGSKWTGKVALIDEQLALPLRWRRPRRIFVNSMSDLFHEALPDAAIDKVFAVMALAPQHTFQVLTKRAERMRDYCRNARVRAPGFVEHAVGMVDLVRGLDSDERRKIRYEVGVPYPLPNVWLGVSVEDQERADERIPHLLATPAAVRFLSCEPLLGRLDLAQIAVPDDAAGKHAGHGYSFNALQREDDLKLFNAPAHVDWVICGGESGRDARPMHPDWARSLRDQCAVADVPFFFKQWGEWAPFRKEMAEVGSPAATRAGYAPATQLTPNGAMQRVGKKAAGRLLDGVEHNGFPHG
jgi:protein gp37